MTSHATSPPDSIPSAPPPWTTKSTSFLLPFYHSPSQPLPFEKAYAPLSASYPPFSKEPECGVFKGGVGFLQLLRYSESPVGPYDEMAVMPGDFEYSRGEEGKEKKKERNSRVTGIWVSQRDTCWNGRMNWNLPKHIARFKFTPADDTPGSKLAPPLKIEVFPEDPSADEPFFTAHIQPIRWFPPFPFSFALAPYVGLDSNLVQPPLPQGDSPELCGTDDWKKSKPSLSSWKTRLVWFDMKQPRAKVETASEGDEEGDALLQGKPKDENWWPGMRRWQIGLWLEDAKLLLGEAETWKVGL